MIKMLTIGDENKPLALHLRPVAFNLSTQHALLVAIFKEVLINQYCDEYRTELRRE